MLLFKLMIIVVVAAIIAFAWGLVKLEASNKRRSKK
jgi:uncharacterized membrane protein (DUF106 family)